MVVKITSSTRPKIEAVYFCTVAGANGNTCGRKLRGDEKQLIDLEWPYSWGGITYGCHGIESLTVGGVEMLTVGMEWLTYTVPITAGVESPMANRLRLETLTVAISDLKGPSVNQEYLSSG